jgi:hypothetical protein
MPAPVPKLIDYALTRMVLGQAFVVFQAFSLRTFGSTKLRNLRLLSQNFSFGKASIIAAIVCFSFFGSAITRFAFYGLR